MVVVSFSAAVIMASQSIGSGDDEVETMLCAIFQDMLSTRGEIK